MDLESFKAKVLCGARRTKLRGLNITCSGWRLKTDPITHKISLTEQDGKAYILAILLEGLYNHTCGSDYGAILAKKFGMNWRDVSAFNQGFCANDIRDDPNYYALGAHCQRIFL